MSKKLLWIIAGVAVLYLAWKKGLLSRLANMTSSFKTTEYDEESMIVNSDPNAFASELKSFMKQQEKLATKMGMTDAERRWFLGIVRNIYIWCHDDDEINWNHQNVAEKALEDGLDVDREYAYQALWAMGPEGWKPIGGPVTFTTLKERQQRYELLKSRLFQ